MRSNLESRAMSTTARIAVGVLLAAGGFALGHFAASSAGSGAAAPATAAAGRKTQQDLLALLGEPDAFKRAAGLGSLIPALGPEAVPAVREALERGGPDLGAVEISLLVRFWAAHEPESATLWAFGKAPIGYRIPAIVPAVETWARLDPMAAAQQVKAMGGGFRGPNIDAADIALVRGWFASGHHGLDRYMRDLGLTREQQRALAVFARETIRRDGTEAIMKWAEAQPDSRERYKLAAFRQVGSELAKAEPSAAVTWCEAHCEGPFGEGILQLVATRWAEQDGPAAMRWLSTAPPGKERERATRDAFRAWRRNDEAGVLEWFGARGDDAIEPWLRPAVGLYAMAISGEDPLGAFQWAARIEDEEKRQLAFVTIARRWRGRDETAAEAWLEQSPLSEEDREKVRTPLPPVRQRPKTGQPPPTSWLRVPLPDHHVPQTISSPLA